MIINFELYLLTKSIMYNPFHGYFDSYYLFSLPYASIYLNYEQLVNQPKISSNIILIKNQSETTNLSLQTEKCQVTQENQWESLKTQLKQKQIFTQVRQTKNERQNQVTVRRVQRASKQKKKFQMVQKQGRNSHSNILRKFFKLLSMESEFRSLVEKIIRKLGLEMSVERYFILIKNIDHRNYIRIRQVEGVFEDNKSWINKITRILFQNYLQNYYVQHLLSSKKTDNNSVVFHLKGKRTIKEEVYGNRQTKNHQDYHYFSKYG